MRSLYRNIRADFIKIKHTAFPSIHYVMAVIGAITFLCFFKIYEGMDINQRFTIILELTAMIFPMLIGIVSALLVMQEEKAGNFQVMFIGNGSKLSAYLSKIIVMGIYELISFILLIGVFILSIKIFFPILDIPYKLLISAVGVLILGNIELYFIHLFISLKFGMGSSIFLGVLESLMVVLFSNIELSGKWLYIPFAWGIKLCNMVIDNQLRGIDIVNEMQSSIYIICIITILSIVLSLIWFQNWEGRRTYE